MTSERVLTSTGPRGSRFARPAVVAATLIAAALSWGRPRTARADEPESAEARALITEAVAEYDGHRYEEARALFRRAHEMQPSARTLRGIGMASFELRDYVQALRNLQSSLQEQRRPLTPEQRRHVQQLIERTQTYVGRFNLTVVPATATVRVDGKLATFEDAGVLLLGFGMHTVTVEAAGYLAASRDISVIGGERQTLAVARRPAARPAAPGADPALAGGGGGTGLPDSGLGAPGAGEAGGGVTSRPAFWFISAGALATGALGAGLWARQLDGELERCRDAGDACLNEDTLETRFRVALGVALGLGVGAATMAIIGGVVWSRKPQTAPATAFVCAPGPGTVQCAFRF
jgi:hypothetical protein